MDAKTRRVLKAKQSQQGALDTSIAAVANKKANENILIPKIWVKDITMPGSAGKGFAVLPSFIAIDSVVSMNVILEISSSSGAENLFYTQPPADFAATTTFFMGLHKQTREIRMIGLGGILWPNRPGKLTIFYI